MPRRRQREPIARLVGARIRFLREERKLTLDDVALDWDLSKGYLSDVESGFQSPSFSVLAKIARSLKVDLLDLFTFPEASERQRLVEQTRRSPPAAVKRLLRDLEKR